jgi:hypothetical protein
VQDVEDEPLFAERVAGIDIAKAGVEVTIRVPSDTQPGRRQQETRSFGTTRRQLLALADWLRSWSVTKAGMEATDVIRGPNTRKLDIAQVMPSQTRLRREGQKRQRRGAAATPALRSAVCVADGPQITRLPRVAERTKRAVAVRRRRPLATPDNRRLLETGVLCPGVTRT